MTRSTTFDVIFHTALLAGLVYFSVDAWSSGQRLWSGLRADIYEKKAEIAELEARAEAFEAKIARLTGPTVDRELLDERLRAAYGVARADEVLLTPPAR